eukprot:1250827-Prymnesium_polylepis.1
MVISQTTHCSQLLSIASNLLGRTHPLRHAAVATRPAVSDARGPLEPARPRAPSGLMIQPARPRAPSGLMIQPARPRARPLI